MTIEIIHTDNCAYLLQSVSGSSGVAVGRLGKRGYSSNQCSRFKLLMGVLLSSKPLYELVKAFLQDAKPVTVRKTPSNMFKALLYLHSSYAFCKQWCFNLGGKDCALNYSLPSVTFSVCRFVGWPNSPSFLSFAVRQTSCDITLEV